MTDRQAKQVSLQSAGRMRNFVCQRQYPPGSARLLIWFERGAAGDETLYYRSCPVICDKDLESRVLFIESKRVFYAWGLNPWTGELADLQFINKSC